MTDKELTAEAKRIQKLFIKETGVFWTLKTIKEQLKEKTNDTQREEEIYQMD